MLNMKIDDAIVQYRGICEVSEAPPFYQITSQLIESGHDESFENDSYFDALCLTHVMLQRTFVGASVLTGSGASKFWSALSSPLEKCLTRLSLVGGKFRMIALNVKDDLNYFKSLKEKFPNTFELVTAKASSDVTHFIICDSRMVRVEELHPPLDTEDASDDLVKAKVNFNDPLGSKHHGSFFEAVWSKLNQKSAPVAATK